MKGVEAFLYDAAGHDERVELEDVNPGKLAKKQLLWVNVLKRDESVLNEVAKRLDVKNVPCEAVLDDTGRPTVERFETFFRFCVDSVVSQKDKPPEKLMVDFIVGKNFVVTVHEEEIDYFDEFRKREKGETQFGEMDAESFVATLLDLNLVSYFDALDELERRIDKMDEKVLKTDFEVDEFLKVMVDLRSYASKLRRWLLPHREVFYALSRADFQQIAESDSYEQFQMLNRHFESAVDAIENARDSVLSVFELYATKSSQLTNVFIQRLTFFTLITGSLAVIAGILGMNYKAAIFESENGFWTTVGGMVLIAIALTIYARRRRWI